MAVRTRTEFEHIWNTFDLIVTGYSAVAFLQHLITAYDREHSVGLAIAKPAKQDKSG